MTLLSPSWKMSGSNVPCCIVLAATQRDSRTLKMKME